jgi:hypothetical protein
MNGVVLAGLDRLARLGLSAAARRWPADISEAVRSEWAAELAAIQDDPRLSRLAKAYRTVTFAGSLALSPAVEADGAEPVAWRDRLVPPAAAAGLLLVAAAAFNAVHVADHRSAATSVFALVMAALTMATLGYRFRGKAIAMTFSMGVTMFAFLMAGNQVAVMPFMGWRDIVPAATVWTLLTAAAVAVARRRRVLGMLTALLALEAAAVVGSLHAAHVLKLGLASAPAWFPLALMPGRAASFGPYFPDGTAAFGGLHESGPAFHASQILLGNASAMVGPMLLCSIFVLAMALRRAPFDDPALRADLRIPLGVTATAGVLACAEWLRQSSDEVESTLHRVIDNSNVFGFGFLADTPGRIALALLGGLLVGHLGTSRRRGQAG